MRHFSTGLIIVGVVLMVLGVSAQTFQPVGTTQVMTAAPSITGPVLITGNEQPLVTIVGGVLYAELDPTVGQAAVDSCNSTGNPPPISNAGGLGTTATCENNRTPAMVTDAQNRAKQGIAQIPAATLVQFKLHTVQ